MTEIDPGGTHVGTALQPTHEDVQNAAIAISEQVRYLNHATIGDHPEVMRYAVHIYDLIGPLSTAAARLPQLLEQLARRCDKLSYDPSLTHYDAERSPVQEAYGAYLALEEAQKAADVLRRELQRAHQHLSGLGHIEEAEEDDQEGTE
jgi:hypothetical protein